MPFQLPELSYSQGSLAPVMSEETLEFHHGKHHAAYVRRLNDLIREKDQEESTLEEIILGQNANESCDVFNNAAQHWNHSFFWKCLSPNGGKKPSGAVAGLIARCFGGFDAFRVEFTSGANLLFGSGWTWLVQNREGDLEIFLAQHAEHPMQYGKKALLALDVWEHAYYIDYRNERARFVEAFWDIINWDHINRQLASVRHFDPAMMIG